MDLVHHIFATLTALITGPIDATLTGLVARNLAASRTLTAGIATLMFSLGTILDWFNRKTELGERSITKVGAIALMGAMCYGPYYTEYVVGAFNHGIPDWLNASVAGVATGRGVAFNSGDAFDVMLDGGWMLGTELFAAAGWSPQGLACCFMVLIYWIVIFILDAINWAVHTGLGVLTVVLLAMGPIAGLCVGFDSSRKYARGWLDALVTCVVAKYTVVTIMAFMVGVVAQFIRQVSGILAGGTSLANAGQAFLLLFAAAVVFLVTTVLSLAGCWIAGSITHSTVTSAMGSMAHRLAGTAAGAADKAVDATRTAAGYTAAAGKAANANVRASGINATTSGTTPAGHAARMRQQAANNPTGPMVGASYPWRT